MTIVPNFFPLRLIFIIGYSDYYLFYVNLQEIGAIVAGLKRSDAITARK